MQDPEVTNLTRFSKLMLQVDEDGDFMVKDEKGWRNSNLLIKKIKGGEKK